MARNEHGLARGSQVTDLVLESVASAVGETELGTGNGIDVLDVASDRVLQ